jgi:division protein CdvB (Snf7/Vps24/ESCRT-III family)
VVKLVTIGHGRNQMKNRRPLTEIYEDMMNINDRKPTEQELEELFEILNKIEEEDGNGKN